MGGTAGLATGTGGPCRRRRGGSTGTGGTAGTTGAGGSAGQSGTGGSTGTNPWIAFDPASIVSRSNIILAHANTATSQIMPIGNGNLGAAVWAANGFTAQLNRADTMPNRLSPGWLTIPGLSTITGASDFKGTLNLYDGELVESGGGMTAKIYIRADSDELVVDVTGANTSTTYTATVSLWSSRNPTAAASGAVATLAESWTDSGSLVLEPEVRLARRADRGRAERDDLGEREDHLRLVQAQLGRLVPRHLRVPVVSTGAPPRRPWPASCSARDATKAGLDGTHTAWWHSFWGRVGLMKITTSDGSGEYLENIRAIFLYAHASESRGVRPGSQAGVADFYNFSQDAADWYAAGYWFWNLRMQVAATMTSGAFDLNAPLFNLYASNVSNLQAWTKSQMGNRVGICVPETMRFNGNGWWYAGSNSCDDVQLAQLQRADALERVGGRPLDVAAVSDDAGQVVPADQLPVHARGRALPAHLRHDGERRQADDQPIERARGPVGGRRIRSPTSRR